MIRLDRWRLITAACVAVIILIAIVLSMVFSGSSSKESAPKPNDVEAPVVMGPSGVSMTSVTETPHPPPPGETFLFQGKIKNWPGSGTGYEAVFVVAEPNGVTTSQTRRWLVSPPAKILHDGTWNVRWTLSDPPNNTRWVAAYVNSPIPIVGEWPSVSPSPVYSPLGSDPVMQDFRSSLSKYGPFKSRYPAMVQFVSSAIRAG